MTSSKLARLLSEVFAPWVSNVVFFLILGAHTSSWPGAIAAAIGTGVVPMGAIFLLMRRGSVGDHHVTTREQRAGVLSLIAAVVVALLILLWGLSADRLIVAGVASALVFLVVFGAITAALKIKASIHVGLWVCLTTFLTITVSPWIALGYLVTGPVAWARYRIEHHTVKELMVGAIAGVAVSAFCCVIFL